jgi:hypothetical protein
MVRSALRSGRYNTGPCSGPRSAARRIGDGINDGILLDALEYLDYKSMPYVTDTHTP